MKKACIFDLDGTLVDSIQDITAACNHALQKFGFSAKTYRDIQSYFGDGIAKVIERSMPEASRNPKNIDMVKEEMMAYYSSHLTVTTEPFKGIWQLLEKLLEMKMRLFVVSNKVQYQTKTIVNMIFGEKIFEKVVGLGPNVPRKPDPFATLRCIEEAGLKANECFFIGDSPGDVATAKKAGIEPIAVSWGYFPVEILIRAGADLIINDPIELIALLRR